MITMFVLKIDAFHLRVNSKYVPFTIIREKACRIISTRLYLEKMRKKIVGKKIRFGAIILLGIAGMLGGCAVLRHEYDTVARQIYIFNTKVHSGTQSTEELEQYYTEHIASYIATFDTVAHSNIHTLLTTPTHAPLDTYTATKITLLLQLAVYQGILSTITTLPTPALHLEGYQRIKYLYRFIQPFIVTMSDWSGRSDLDATCSFQISRLNIYPFSHSSQRAVAALQNSLLRAFLLGMFHTL